MIALMIVVTLVFAFLLSLISLIRESRILSNILFLTGIFSPLLILWVYMYLVPYSTVLGNWERILGIEVVIDSYNLYFLMAESIVLISVGIYSLLYFENSNRNKYFSLILLIHAGLMGAFLSRDLFNYFVMMEIVSVSSFILIALSEGNKAKKAAFRYLLFSLVASYLFLLSVGIIYLKTGHLNLELIGTTVTSSREITIAVSLAFSALILKAGIFPLHFWLPAVYTESSTPVSALMSGIVGKVAIYGMVLFVLYLPLAHLMDILLIVAFTSVFFGIVMRFLSYDVKKFLSYSSVTQMGFILIGIATLNIMGAIYWALAHAIIKSSLFLTLGTVGDIIKSRDMRTISYRDNPIIIFSVIVFSLAIAGISPTLGGFAKTKLLINLENISVFFFYAGVTGTLLMMSKLNYYLWGWGIRKKLKSHNNILKSIVPTISSIIIILFGFYLSPFPSVKDICTLLGALVLFIIIKKLHIFGIELPHIITKHFAEIGPTNNICYIVYIIMILLLLIQVP